MPIYRSIPGYNSIAEFARTHNLNYYIVSNHMRRGKCALVKQDLRGQHELYGHWNAMITRCHNKNHPTYKDYGARGIHVCSRWRCVTNGFWNFVEDMGEKPTSEHTLERIDNSKGYDKHNCKWATRKEQSNNRRQEKLSKNNTTGLKGVSRSNGKYQVRKTINGKRKCLGYVNTLEEAKELLERI